jgi:hypothetical protein
MIESGATHIGVATDHVVESFRNDLYPGYKTSEGVPEELLSQFPVLEEALEAMGVTVWPMVRFEADDALASAAAKAAQDDRVKQVLICTPDKDLSQCVVGTRVVQVDRRRNILRDEAGVVAKFGVKPQSIPGYLAVVGDSADGFPGVPGWGIKAAALTLSQYPHLGLSIPILKTFRRIGGNGIHQSKGPVFCPNRYSTHGATPCCFALSQPCGRLDVPVFDTVEDLRWKGPRSDFEECCRRIKSPNLFGRVTSAKSMRSRNIYPSSVPIGNDLTDLLY